MMYSIFSLVVNTLKNSLVFVNCPLYLDCLSLMNATPQNTNPNQQSNNEDIKDNKSEKNGITSAITKARTQNKTFKPIQTDQPLTVC